MRVPRTRNARTSRSENSINTNKNENSSSNSINSSSTYRKIFVGGLHYITGESGLVNYFLQFGPIETCSVMYNRETNKSRGFGFITFTNSESVSKVLATRMHTIDNKEVEVKSGLNFILFVVRRICSLLYFVINCLQQSLN